MKNSVLTFGEIMLRLSPPNNLRIVQTRSFDAIYGGGEANVAASLANFGMDSYFVTRLPNNEIGQACLNFLRQYGVKVDKIIFGGNRLGIYFLETGISMRPSKVIYDRENSAIATATPEMFDWDKIFDDEISWFHWTGITPAISQNLAEICLDAIKVARSMDLTISCDLNYRSKLWKYGKKPIEVMDELVKYCDIIIGNEEDAEKVFGIKAPDTDIISGKIDPNKYKYVAQELKKRFHNAKYVAITLRGSLSASHNTWAGVLYDDENNLYISSSFNILPILDRVGGGDAFVAGLIYGFLNFEQDKQKILDFAVASSCLKHTIFGDFNLISVKEVLKVMEGDVSGRVSR